MLGVSLQKEQELLRRMEKLQVYEDDLEESFVRSRGPGGQNVNKVATCVVLRHIPTGITVKCQKERLQGQNRYLAREMLLDEIERRRAKAIRQEIYEREKARRQKRRRTKASKEYMLEMKHRHSLKKKERKSLAPHRIEE